MEEGALDLPILREIAAARLGYNLAEIVPAPMEKYLKMYSDETIAAGLQEFQNKFIQSLEKDIDREITDI